MRPDTDTHDNTDTHVHTDTQRYKHTQTHTHTAYKPLRSLNPDSRAPQAWSLPASLTAGHHGVPHGPDLGPPFPPTSGHGEGLPLPRAGWEWPCPGGQAEARLQQKTGERQPPPRSGLLPSREAPGARCTVVTWSPGAGGLASGRVAAGASEHLMEHLPEVPLLPVPRLPRSFSALL